jgi:vWA found in TerF C terminus
MGVDLTKRAETAQVSLIKAMEKVSLEKGIDLGDVSAQVILVLDFSGSMSARYDRKDADGKSEMDLCAERVLGLSLSGLDADGKVPFYMFHQGVFPADVLEQANYLGFIDAWRAGPPFVIGPAPAAPPATPAAPAKKKWWGGKAATTAAAGPDQQLMYRSMGGTDYLPAIKKIIADCREQGLFEPGEPPVLVVFLTDGSTDNTTAIEKELKAAADLPIFWQFIGLGYEPAFLKKLNAASGSRVDNVGLIVWNANTAQMSDTDFYDALIKEFIGKYLPAAQAAGIVKWKAAT